MIDSKKIPLNLDHWLTDEHTGVHNAPKTRIILSDTYMQGMNPSYQRPLVPLSFP